MKSEARTLKPATDLVVQPAQVIALNVPQKPRARHRWLRPPLQRLIPASCGVISQIGRASCSERV